MLVQPGGITGIIVVIILGAVSLAFFFYGLYERYILISAGRQESRGGHVLRRLAALVPLVFGQWTLLRSVTRNDRAGLTHFFIFWGGMAFIAGYLLFVFAPVFSEDFAFKVLGQTGGWVISLIVDALGALALIAVVWGLIRRFIVRLVRQTASGEWLYFSSTIIALLLVYFFLEAFRIIETGKPDSVVPVPIGMFLADSLKSLGLTGSQVRIWYGVLWWSEFAVICAFLVHSRYSEHMHAIAAPLNFFFGSLEPKGELRPVNMKTAREFTTATIDKLTWKELLDGLTCTECGRCQMACPAYLSGKVLNPKEIIQKVRGQLLSKRNRNKVVFGESGQGISEEAIWDCTTCRACQQQCPVSIEHVGTFVDFRRQLVERGKLSASTRNTLENIYTLGNPWGQSQTVRTDLAKQLGLPLVQETDKFEYLYWIGCASAYDERARNITRAVSTLLSKAGIKYAVLGAEEKCCGDPPRRIGEEGLFQQRASANIETLKKYNVRRILVHCPHCFNTFKNEYLQLGAGFEVVHHSELILDLINTSKLSITRPIDYRLTFHDPCYLGRYNDLYDVPRQIIRVNAELRLVEMKAHREGAFCCGAGGGHFWMSGGRGSRMENMRLEQAKEVGVHVIASACPYCVVMLDTAASGMSTDRIKVLDIAELVLEAV